MRHRYRKGIDILTGIGIRVARPAWWNGAIFCLSWIAIVAGCVLVWAAAITLLP